MKSLILESVVAVLLIGGPADALCLYQGVPYSEGARICMHRTMFMCRGERWIKTAERCWERSSPLADPLPWHAGQRLPGAPAQVDMKALSASTFPIAQHCWTSQQ